MSNMEELYLLDMLGISFDKRKIQPMFSSGNITTPDITGKFLIMPFLISIFFTILTCLPFCAIGL